MKAKALEDITKREFQALATVCRLRKLNIQSRQAAKLAWINQTTHLAIIKYHKELCKKWPDVWQEERP